MANSKRYFTVSSSEETTKKFDDYFDKNNYKKKSQLFKDIMENIDFLMDSKKQTFLLSENKILVSENEELRNELLKKEIELQNMYIEVEVLRSREQEIKNISLNGSNDQTNILETILNEVKELKKQGAVFDSFKNKGYESEEKKETSGFRYSRDNLR